MKLDYGAITTAATVIAVLISMYAIWEENRRSRFSQGIDLLMRLSDTFFYSKDFVDNRRKAAKFLYKIWFPKGEFRDTQNNSAQSFPQSGELDTVLDFFEGIALLIRKGAIDIELASNYFYWWFDCYYSLSLNYMIYWQKDDQVYWSEVIWFRQKLDRFHKKKVSKDGNKPSLETIRKFLKEEMVLK